MTVFRGATWPGKVTVAVVFSIAGLCGPRDAWAWVEHEHSVISNKAIHRALAGPGGVELERAWAALRREHPEARLCERIEAPAFSVIEDCVSFAHLPMLAGDHSCSPEELLGALIHPDGWVRRVIAVAGETHREMAEIVLEGGTIEEQSIARENARKAMNLKLLGADDEYVSRAAANTAHFVARLDGADEDLDSYLARVLSPGQPASAVSSWLAYHSYALGLMRTPGFEHWAIIYEAYALHFLEDAFAAGHLIGVAESDGGQMGAHDHYGGEGLAVEPWKRDPAKRTGYTAYGDGFLQREDLDRASAAIGASLSQLAESRAAKYDTIASLDRTLLFGNAPDTCGEYLGPDLRRFARTPARDVLELTPRPLAVRPPYEQLRPNYGFLIPVFATAGLSGRYAPTQGSSVFARAIVAGIGVGVAAEDILESRSDATFSLSIAAVLQSTSIDVETSADEASATQGGLFGVASTGGLGLFWRMPYRWLPGDALVWGIPAAAGSEWGLRMAHQSFLGGGGIIPIKPVLLEEPLNIRFELGRTGGFLLHWERYGAVAQVASWEFVLPVFFVGREASGPSIDNELGVHLVANLGHRFAADIVGPGEVREQLEQYDGFFMGGTAALTWSGRYFPF